MTGLIQKSGYIKPGSGGGHYAEYIATRDGVELIKAPPQPSHQGGGYLDYMARRPRSHGLFSADGPAQFGENHGGDQRPYWSGVDLRLLPAAGGCRAAGLRNQRELAWITAGSSGGAGGGDEDSAGQLSLVRSLPR